MKNFESPTMFSVPGLTASQDSEWFEFSICGPQVPGTGFVEPGGTGYPPPRTGLLTTTFVPTTFHAAEADPALASTPSTASAKRSPFIPCLLSLRGSEDSGRPGMRLLGSRRRGDSDKVALWVGEDAEADAGNRLSWLDDATAEPLCFCEGRVDIVDTDEEEHLIGVALQWADGSRQRFLDAAVDERVAGIGAVRVGPP